MPFVQRNWKGEITGLFANAQPGSAEEELAEDSPEIVAFNSAHPMPAEMLRPITPQKIAQMHQDRVLLEKAHDELRASISAFNGAFGELETALSALLYEALHIRKSQVAYAIYYSPTVSMRELK